MLKTELSPSEVAHYPDSKFKYYVTEKNDLGILWSVHYSWREAKLNKIEHNGHSWQRERVNLYDKDKKIKKQKKISELKKVGDCKKQAKYHLLLTNCHWYARDLMKILSD